MNQKTISTILIVIMGLVLGLTTTSCKKEKSTVAKILVLDTSGNPVENAMVHLFPTPTITPPNRVVIGDTLYSDEKGQATFDYTDKFNLGQSGFAVLNIEILSGAFTGEGIIKIEEEKINEETVIIQ